MSIGIALTASVSDVGCAAIYTALGEPHSLANTIICVLVAVRRGTMHTNEKEKLFECYIQGVVVCRGIHSVQITISIFQKAELQQQQQQKRSKKNK